MLFQACATLLILLVTTGAGPADPLPSWSDGPAKQAIVAFVDRVTLPISRDFVAKPERIATFDNDGTLWTEQPLYNEMTFSVERVHELAPRHPEWRTEEPFSSILAGDLQAAVASDRNIIQDVFAATHSGMSVGAFASTVDTWLAKTRHPRFNRPYTELVYQPMLELLHYLRSRGFKTYIVSGGSTDFMRPWVERVYGIPPEQVIGSRLKLAFDLTGERPELQLQPALEFNDDGPSKPISIQQTIGRRPLAAFGNSDGDLQMLQWTTAGSGARFGLIVHHTDAEREWAYDRNSWIGHLAQALDEAPAHGWTVVDMKKDWRVIFPWQLRKGTSDGRQHQL